MFWCGASEKSWKVNSGNLKWSYKVLVSYALLAVTRRHQAWFWSSRHVKKNQLSIFRSRHRKSSWQRYPRYFETPCMWSSSLAWLMTSRLKKWMPYRSCQKVLPRLRFIGLSADTWTTRVGKGFIAIQSVWLRRERRGRLFIFHQRPKWGRKRRFSQT